MSGLEGFKMNRFLGMGVSFLRGFSWPNGLGVVRHHTNGIWLRERMYVPSLSHVQLFVTPWTVVHQIPLSMGFSRQEYWSGLPFPSPGDLPNQRGDNTPQRNPLESG